MMPIVDKYADMGTVVIGKVESGHCVKGQSLAIYPNRQEVKVDQVMFWFITNLMIGDNWSISLQYFLDRALFECTLGQLKDVASNAESLLCSG